MFYLYIHWFLAQVMAKFVLNYLLRFVYLINRVQFGSIEVHHLDLVAFLVLTRTHARTRKSAFVI